MVADVVRAPKTPEFLASFAQFTHKIMAFLVVRVQSGFGAQDGDDHPGGGVTAGVEVVGALVEKGETGQLGCWPGMSYTSL